MGSLSGLASVISPALTMAGVPGTLIGLGTSLYTQQKARDELRAQQDSALQQLQARQDQSEQLAVQDAERARTQLAADAQDAETRRRAALRRAVARQKTLFSAQGLSGMEGSNEAVLLGLYNEDERETAQQAQNNDLRLRTIDQGLDQQRRKNLLETAQLAERQYLARMLEEY